MNYLKEILAFENWKEFNVPISMLSLKSGLNKSAIYRSRNKLKQMGLIDFKERSGTQSTTYKVNAISSL